MRFVYNGQAFLGTRKEIIDSIIETLKKESIRIEKDTAYLGEEEVHVFKWNTIRTTRTRLIHQAENRLSTSVEFDGEIFKDEEELKDHLKREILSLNCTYDFNQMSFSIGSETYSLAEIKGLIIKDIIDKC